MGKKQSLRNKAAHFVSDLTTVLLNPISDNNNSNNKPSKSPSIIEEEGESESRGSESDGSPKSDLVDGPDTSSFSAFLYSLLSSSSDSGHTANLDQQSDDDITDDPLSDSAMKENVVVARKGLFSNGKLSLGRAVRLAARMGGFRSQDRKDNSGTSFGDGRGSKFSGVEMGQIQPVREEPVVSSSPLVDGLLGTSEPSMLLTDDIRNAVYASLPALIHGRKWLMLYSSWKHGISLSTLYRRSMIWPGLSLLVTGDRKGAVFGGLVEAPLRPSNKRKYQGTNNSFVFTNTSGCPVIYRPTGVNRYFTLCTTDFIAIGGGGHFALYLDGDLLNGSSSVSETYGNPCLAHSEDFQVKEVELWGFVFPSQYDEIVALSKTESHGICRW